VVDLAELKMAEFLDVRIEYGETQIDVRIGSIRQLGEEVFKNGIEMNHRQQKEKREDS
jgi:hypothetical protein